MFGFKKRHDELTTAIAALTDTVAGLHSRLNALDRRIEQTHTAIAGASQESRNHADVVLAAVAEHSQHIHALKHEHENLRAVVNDTRHAVEHVRIPSRDVPVRN